MLSHPRTHLKCDLPVTSHFHSTSHLLSSRTTWSLSNFPILLNSCNLRVLRFPYTKMSSRVTEKAENNVALQNNLREGPLSYSYEAAMEALSSLITRQKRTDRTPVAGKYGKLERMSEYLKILDLGDKIEKLKFIHVAGTKGKGSTCAFCEAILRECGFRTGLFTSPHLIDVRERFRLNGDDISEEKFLQYFWDCWSQLKEKVSDDLPMPPLFQFLTILAFKVFVCEQVDVAIIEVGLGGTNDSTNVIEKPIVCGIASLGMDHMETLGDTLGKIASHKAGIFKPEIPAFTVPQLAEAMEVIEERASELMVPLTIASPVDPQKLEGLQLGLSGDHQFTNAGLAVSLCKCWLQKTQNWDNLIGKGVDKEEPELPDAFLRGLSTARLSGRAQIVHDTHSRHYSSSKHPLESVGGGELIFYLDGAHSPESMEACAKWFSSATKENKMISSRWSLSYEVQNKKFFQGNSPITNGRAFDESDKKSKQILLFNCMEVRDPQILLPRLVETCALSGTHFSKALFVPSMSTYSRVTSGASIVPYAVASTKDLTWQFNLQRIWEKIIHGKDVGLEKGGSVKVDKTAVLPPIDFLHTSAVIPSLPLTIKWLRDCAQQNPSLRFQVLVTGSLHLVGDVLKLLKR